MIRCLSTVLALGLALVCLSCVTSEGEFGPDSLVISELKISYDGHKLQQIEIKRDIDFLIYALDTAYAGALFLPAEQYVRLVNGLKAIKSMKESKRESFCEQIASAFATVDDYHLRVTAPKCRGGKSSRRRPNVGPNFHKAMSPPFLIKNTTRGDLEVGMIALTRFTAHSDPVWNGFDHQVKKLVQSSDAIIIDLRGNGGGDDTKGMDLAEVLYGQRAPTPKIIAQRTTPEALTIFRNIYFQLIEEKNAVGEEVPSGFHERYSSLSRKIDLAKAGELPDVETRDKSKVRSIDSDKLFQGQIFVLQDAGCASSCESMLEALEVHPYVTTIGDNSGGYVQFGEVSPIQLPNSKIRIQVPTKFFSHPDKRFVEKVGYKPDIIVSSGDDALEVAMQLLQQ